MTLEVRYLGLLRGSQLLPLSCAVFAAFPVRPIVHLGSRVFAKVPNDGYETSVYLFLVFFIGIPSILAGWREQNFPNYFMMVEPKGSPEVQDQVRLKLIKDAFDSITQRLQMPYLEGTTLKSDKWFLKKLTDKVLAVDPGAKVYLGGGVARSILGYLYQQLYDAHQKNPGTDTAELLTSIINEKEPIASQQVLGVGSDFDVLIDPSSPSLFEKTSKQATDFILSAETAANLRHQGGKLKHSIVPLADVKCFDSQVGEAFSQGGSALDLIGFELNSRNFRFPEKLPTLLLDFLHGQYDYLPSSPRAASSNRCPDYQTYSTDEDKQLIRGLRPLLEIPFLSLSPSGEKQLTSELQMVTQKIAKRGHLSPGAKEQIDKLSRNARIGAAGNRFYRSSDEIEKQIRLLGEEIEKVNHTFVPEFVDRVNLDSRTLKEKARFLDPFLTNLDDFKKTHTQNGMLFHGTPNLGGMYGIVRNGLLLSRPGDAGSPVTKFGASSQGTAVFGQGGYTTPDYETACSYASGEGCILRLELRQHPNVRVLTFGSGDQKKREKLDSLCAEANLQFRDCKEYLAREYGVDIIVDQHVLVQNSEVLKLPSTTQDLIRIEADAFIFKHFSKPDGPFDGSLVASDLKRYSSLYSLGVVLGHKKVESPIRVVLSPIIQKLPKNYAKESDIGVLLRSLNLDEAKTSPRDKALLNFTLSHFKDFNGLGNELMSIRDADKSAEEFILLLKTISQHPSPEIREFLPQMIASVSPSVMVGVIRRLSKPDGNELFPRELMTEVQTSINRLINQPLTSDVTRQLFSLMFKPGIGEAFQIQAIQSLASRTSELWTPDVLAEALLSPSVAVRDQATEILCRFPFRYVKHLSSRNWVELIRNASPLQIDKVSSYPLIDETYPFFTILNSLLKKSAEQNQIINDGSYRDPSTLKLGIRLIEKYKGNNVKAFSSLLKDSHSEVRLAAAHALVQFNSGVSEDARNESPAPLFVGCLSQDEKDPRVRQACLESLSLYRGKNSDDLLSHFLTAKSSPEEIKAAAGMLQNYDGNQHDRWVRKLLTLAKTHPELEEATLSKLPNLFLRANPEASKKIIKELSKAGQPKKWRVAAAASLENLLKNGKFETPSFFKDAPWISKLEAEKDPEIKGILRATLDKGIENYATLGGMVSSGLLRNTLSLADQQKIYDRLKSMRAPPLGVVMELLDFKPTRPGPDFKKLGLELGDRLFENKYEGSDLLKKIMTDPQFSKLKAAAYRNLVRVNCYLGDGIELFEQAFLETEQTFVPLIRDSWQRCLSTIQKHSYYYLKDHCRLNIHEEYVNVCLDRLALDMKKNPVDAKYSAPFFIALSHDTRPTVQSNLAANLASVLNSLDGQALALLTKASMGISARKELAKFQDRLLSQVFFYDKDILAFRLKCAKDADVEKEFSESFLRLTKPAQQSLISEIVKNPKLSPSELSLLKTWHDSLKGSSDLSVKPSDEALIKQVSELLVGFKQLKDKAKMDSNCCGSP